MRGIRHRFAINIGDDDVGAGPCERLRIKHADAFGAAGDNRHSPLEAEEIFEYAHAMAPFLLGRSRYRDG